MGVRLNLGEEHFGGGLACSPGVVSGFRGEGHHGKTLEGQGVRQGCVDGNPVLS